MKAKTAILLAALCALLLAGCTSPKFTENYRQFKDSYLRATAFVESDPNLTQMDVLAKMDPDKMQHELGVMRAALDEMNRYAHNGNTIGVAQNAEQYYKDLEWMLSARKNIGKLTGDERSNVWSQLGFIQIERQDILSGDIDRQ